MPGPMFNPGMGNRCGMMKSPEQIQQEMNQLMQQYNNMEQNQYILGQLGNFYSKPSVNPNTCYNNYGCGGCNGCGCN